MQTEPTLVMVPCFAGAPWQLNQLSHLQHRAMRTLRLPDDVADLETLANFIVDQVKDLECYVLVGDSYGAVASIAVATRQPKGLKGLVLSGGFAKSPITSPLLKTLAALAPFFPGPFYRQTTLRFHAAQLASSFDKEGEIPWSTARSRAFFIEQTPHKAYVNRVRSIETVDYTALLAKIDVPTLILTPEEDKLIGKEAAGILLKGIKTAQEVVMPRTGHMFRFSHPGAYSLEVSRFLQRVAL
ncbi:MULTISPECIES: alpha/beta fold hydrolase [unclassified Pseudomonas]|uniref:alpha/beta fold hydrolase n=1 Tax=unclassified Pseudomonas TaxID=196821 RepID=UPI000CD17539|nr:MULTISPECIES: alpha/beta hydrolase [unclassified Pseudomonas]POA19725.1 alpha/beta hydrolase [Pseudomonas sp. FW305-3-2-15-E-TSA4]POA44478.1 alpha/beta hydrolase [Pseudomonas sp. FW305-3-2-15-E-TSA2]